MRKQDVIIGSVYIAKVSGKRVRVRIDSVREVPGYANYYGGTTRAATRWSATNLATGRTVKIRSAQRLTELPPERPALPAGPVTLEGGA